MDTITPYLHLNTIAMIRNLTHILNQYASHSICFIIFSALVTDAERIRAGVQLQ